MISRYVGGVIVKNIKKYLSQKKKSKSICLRQKEAIKPYSYKYSFNIFVLIYRIYF
jgi:hypothetical protein